MSDRLKIAAIQLDIIQRNKAENLENARRAIASLPQGYDIAILPEMFTTGFICKPEPARDLAESMDGPTVGFLKKCAAEYNLALCGSFIAREDDRLFNRAFFIEPLGDEYYYDKRHLFSISGEDAVYTRGDRPRPVFRFRGWNISMAVCFDLRFPAWLRNNSTNPYDLLIIMSNWPDSRARAWQQLIIARAIENQAYVAGCNCKGADDYGAYSGTSLIIDPKGVDINEPFNDLITTATLSLNSLQTFRSKFPVLEEGDRFTM